MRDKFKFVGQVIEEYIGAPDAVFCDVCEDGGLLVLAYNDLTDNEMEMFRSKDVEVKAVLLENYFRFLFKFGTLNWIDTPFALNLSKVKDKDSIEFYLKKVFKVVLIENTKGVIVSISDLVFDGNFIYAAAFLIQKAYTEDFDKDRYFHNMKVLESIYSTEDLVLLAQISTKPKVTVYRNNVVSYQFNMDTGQVEKMNIGKPYEPVIIAIERETIEAFDINYLIALLEEMKQMPDKYRNSVAISVSGYEEDNRDLSQIEAVTKYFSKFFHEYDGLFYWMTLELNMFTIMGSYLCRTSIVDNQVAINPEDFVCFMEKGFEKLRNYCEGNGLDAEESIEDIMQYFGG